jgi:hypothetical protein
LLVVGLTQWLSNPVVERASFLVEEGCETWSLDGWLLNLLFVNSATGDVPFPTTFGLFSGPEEARNVKDDERIKIQELNEDVSITSFWELTM